MTPLAPTSRRRPVSHAFTTPVVRELARAVPWPALLRLVAPRPARVGRMQATAGDLVNVTTSGGSQVEGIVFDTPSAKKVVVAFRDPAKGPGFRTVHPDTLSERTAEGADDHALRALIKRTPVPAHRSGRAGAGAAHGQAGFSRGASHRTSDH